MDPLSQERLSEEDIEIARRAIIAVYWRERLISEVKRLQAIETRYKSVLTDILECYDIPTAVQEIAKNTLEGADTNE